MSTLDLFDYVPPPTAPYAPGSATSREAAESIEPALAHLEQVVLNAVRAAGPAGLTCDQCEIATELAHQTCSARFRGLEQRGILKRTEVRRPTRSGRSAYVYVAVERAA